MGVKGLLKILKREAPNAIKTIKVSKLHDHYNNFMLFDMSILVYAWYHVGSQMAKYTKAVANKTDKTDDVTDAPNINHLYGLLSKIIKLTAVGITPVFVFDSKPPAAKTATIANRKLKRENGALSVPGSAYIECAELIKLMGLQVVVAESEAEAQCAALARQYKIPVVTKDMDALAFGAPVVLREDKLTYLQITLADVLTEMKLSMNEFIDLCILLGCDYTTVGLKSVGEVRALKYIREYHSVENIIKAIDATPDPGFTYVAARKEFKTPAVSEIVLEARKEYSVEAVIAYMVSKGADRDKVMKKMGLSI